VDLQAMDLLQPAQGTFGFMAQAHGQMLEILWALLAPKDPKVNQDFKVNQVPKVRQDFKEVLEHKVLLDQLETQERQQQLV
jgi:hypothetical protein